MHKIYIASASALAPEVAMLQELYADKFEFLSDWPEGVLRGDSEDPPSATAFWRRDLSQIDQCQALIVLSNPQFRLRGAIFEAGYALAKGKRVYLVGSHNDYHTWQYSPGIMRFSSIESALKDIRNAPALFPDPQLPLSI